MAASCIRCFSSSDSEAFRIRRCDSSSVTRTFSASKSAASSDRTYAPTGFDYHYPYLPIPVPAVQQQGINTAGFTIQEGAGLQYTVYVESSLTSSNNADYYKNYKLHRVTQLFRKSDMAQKSTVL